MRRSKVIHFTSPASAWQETCLTGNGFMGLAVYGQPLREEAVLSHITFFSGSDTVCPYREKAREAFENARAAAAEGDFAAVGECTGQFMGIRGNYGTNLPVGKLRITFAEGEKTPSYYDRYLDILNGIAGCSYSLPDGTHKREAFTSHPDHVFAYMLEETSQDGMTFTVSFDGGRNPFRSFFEGNFLCFDTQALEMVHSDGTEGVSLSGMVKVCAQDGVLEYLDEGIWVHGAHRAVIYVAMETDYRLENDGCMDIDRGELKKHVDHTLEEYEELRGRHAQDVRSLMERQELILGAGSETEEVTEAEEVTGAEEVTETEEVTGAEEVTEAEEVTGAEDLTDTEELVETEYGPRTGAATRLPREGLMEEIHQEMSGEALVSQVRAGGDNRHLTELMYQYGRYLLLCSSRADSPLPAHLQGVWNDDVACRIGWSCDMHLDINTQMNYWISEPGNLGECHEPLFRWMEKRLLPLGRQTAEKCYGRKGWAAELVSNAWGYAAPYWHRSLSPCPTGGIWQASDYMEHYRYGQDLDFLKNRALPVLEEAVEFFLDYLFEDQNGFLTCGPSISPENSFVVDGEKQYASNGCTYEIVMIRELFLEYQEICRALGDRKKSLERVEDALPRLVPYRILSDGTLAEWAHDFPAADAQHRHTSHLLGVFPYSQITPQDTPDLAGAAARSVLARTTPDENWEDTGWARTLLTLYSARLLDKEQAGRHLRSIQTTLTGPGLLVMHPPTRGAASFSEVYELDGNTGFSMAVMEILIQSHNGCIRLLPALLTEWPEGELKGAAVRGGIVVDFGWKNGLPVWAEAVSRKDESVVFAFGSRSLECELKAGKKTQIPVKCLLTAERKC